MKYVYLVKKKHLHSYKIGVTKNPQKRLITLQTGNESQLNLIAKYQTSFYDKIERFFKNKYSYYRTNGEWYDIDITVESFIKDCQECEKNLKEIELHEKQT